MRIILQEIEEEKQRLQLQLRAMKEALEKMKCNKGLAKPPSLASKSTNDVNSHDSYLVSFSCDVIFVRSLEVPISGLGYTEGECSKATETRSYLGKESKPLPK